MPNLAICNISLSYDKHHNVISNFSLNASSGECILIEGRNGIGKTTILKAIAGILKPVSGEIKIDDHSIFSIPHSKRKTLVSFSQQSPNYSSPVKVIEFLKMASSTEKQKRVEKFVNLLEIRDLLPKPINLLSDGQKKLALLARTFIQNTKVMLLDEPDAFLDLYNQNLLIRSIKEVLDEGKIVIFVSHNPYFSSQIFTKKVLILSSSNFVFYDKQKEEEKVNTFENLSLISSGRCV